MLDLTDPERQFIEAMRQASDNNLLLVVERIGRGGWEIEMSNMHEGTLGAVPAKHLAKPGAMWSPIGHR